MANTKSAATITVGETEVMPGHRARFELNVARLPTGGWLSLPVAVVNGKRPGPTIWLSGAVHGNEINGVSIVRRVMSQLVSADLAGTVIAVPIVNIFGFVNESRYLPDHRDLNRSFPGSRRGSLAAQLANLFMREVVERCDFGIDLHTAAGHRINIPQIRGDMSERGTAGLGKAFGAPFVLNAKVRPGSLREAATKRGKRVLVYESGQVLRFDADACDVGVAGVLRVMQKLKMGDWGVPKAEVPIRTIQASTWIRGPKSGIADIHVELGQPVAAGTALATISDAFGSKPTVAKAPWAGWVIAKTQNPLISRGDSLVHIAAKKGATVRRPR
ncbi:MAG: succinylglutamate desuccinylase/aspartoacylase family protein [Acidimicrobiia bacterium]